MITTEQLQSLELEIEKETKNLLRLQAIAEQREKKLEADRQEVRDLGYDPDLLDLAIQELENNCMALTVKLKQDLTKLTEQRTKYDQL